MTQPSKKANCDDVIDRISELPGNVIDCILRRMNIQDLIRTTILSTKWRYMWNSVSGLRFDEGFYYLFDKLDEDGHYLSELSRIITEILFLHNGPINEFILQLPRSSENKITYECLNKWTLLLSRKGVESIYLFDDELEDNLQTPSHLFSCKGLTCLKLALFNLSIPPNFSGFKSLLHLHLRLVKFELGSIESLLSGCPLLENLSIVHCSGCECIDLSSSTALIDLTLSLPQNFIFAMNQSLPIIQRLTLELERKVGMLLYSNNFPLSQLIMSLKYLRLYGVNFEEREELLYIVSVLQSAYNLVELDIETYKNNDDKTQAPDPSEKLEFSGCCLCKLQKVNIRLGISTKHAMSLTRFILANSPTLKTLAFKFRFCTISDTSILLSISQDLLWMERASQRAHVIFLHE